jgi:hypothetical protein
MRKNSSYEFFICKTNYPKKYKKNNPFFSHKSFIEELLRLIKRSQNEYLSTIVNEKDIKHKISAKLTKDLLFSLKNNLSSINKEKVNELNIINKEKKENQKNFYRLKKTKTIYKQINQLKDINFQYENEIKKIDDLIKLNNNYLFLITSYDCFMEIFSEKYIKSKKGYKKIEKIFGEQLEKKKLNLCEIENEILLKENNIEYFKEEINNLKNTYEKKENILSNKSKISSNLKDNFNSNSNELKCDNKYCNKKRVNFKINITKDNKDNCVNDFLLKDGKSLKTTNKHKLSNKKILILKERFQKQRFSYPQIKITNNSRKNISQIFLKNNNNCFGNISIINKSINDFDRTTVSSLNDKTIELEKLMNNTI